MSEGRVALLKKLGVTQLETLRDHYESAGDQQAVADVRAAIGQAGAVQTEELTHSGRLFRHRHIDENTGAVTHTYTGDPMAWMQAFTTGAQVCRIPVAEFTGKNSPALKAR